MAAPRKPQDRKPAAAQVEAEAQARFDEIEGHELLKPLSQVKGSDQARLMGRVQSLGLTDDMDEATVDMDDAADFIDYVGEKFAVDPSGFEAFTCGEGGMIRALNLAMGYAAEMGKGAA